MASLGFEGRCSTKHRDELKSRSRDADIMMVPIVQRPSDWSERFAEMETRLDAQETRTLQLAAGLSAAETRLALQEQMIDEVMSVARQRDLVEMKGKTSDHEAISNENPADSAVVVVKMLPEAEETRAMTYSEAKQIYVENEKYALSESAWDAAFFVFTPVTGFLGSVFVSVTIIVNIICQLVFCIIAWTAFSDPENGNFNLNVYEESLLWRLTEGHSTARMDKVSWTSLATRICSLDNSLVLGTGQVGLLSESRMYRSWFGGDYFPFLNSLPYEGVILTAVCLLLWYFTACREILSCIDALNGLCMIPNSGRRSKIIINTDNMFVIDAVGWPRRIGLLLLTLIRMGIAIWLLTSGGWWLCVTSDRFDLILNAAALAFVFELDEHIFTTLSPPMIKRCVSRTTPLKIKREPLVFGLGVKGPIALIVSLVFTYYLFVTGVHPMVERMKIVDETMCGNETRFVVGAGTGLGYAVAVTTNPFKVDVAIDTLLKSATNQIFSTNITVDYLDLLAGRPLEQQGLVAVVVRTEADFNTELVKISDDFVTLECIDELHSSLMGDDNQVVPAFLEALRFRTGEFNATNCSGFLKFCRSLTGVGTWVRSFCSATCKCHSHHGLLVDRSGCSLPCNALIKVELSSHASNFSACHDKPVSWFAGDEVALMLKDLEVLIGVELPKENMSRYGCNTIAAYSAGNYFEPDEAAWVPDALCGRSRGSNIAIGNSKHQTLRMLCPVSCGCSLDMTDQCPRSCENGAFSIPEDTCSRGLCPFRSVRQAEIAPSLSCEDIDMYMKTGDSSFASGSPQTITHAMCEMHTMTLSGYCCCPGSYDCDKCPHGMMIYCEPWAPCFTFEQCGWCNSSEACRDTGCDFCEGHCFCSPCFQPRGTGCGGGGGEGAGENASSV